MNLYELAAEYLFLQEEIEAGQPDSRLDELMADLNDELEKKADNYAKVIRNLEASSTAFAEEIKKLQAKKKMVDNGIDRMKNNLQAVMTETGKTKFKTDLFSFNIQKNGGSLPVIVDVDTSELPDELVVVTEKPNLKAIAAYIEETGDVTWAHFGERGESLRIK